MRILSGEAGVALVTALMLTMLSLVIALTLLYTVTSGTRISASQKRYRSALAAAQGGVQLATEEIIPRLLQMNPSSQSSLQDDFALIALQLPAYGCLQQKLSSPTESWSACSVAQQSGDPAVAPDLTFTLGGAPSSDPGYQVAVKIVDSVPGNSDTSLGNDLLDSGNSVAGKDDIVRPQHLPGIYSIAVQGVGGAARERARLSLLYQY
jgi:Tfp pilus assembly protein PilX